MSYTKEQGKQKIKELVERFRYNLDVYKKSTYNETQVRREFIDPFFDALDWDVSNKQGYAEQYKEVVHEDTIKVGRSTRAPDYSFRVGGQRKFFVEAKKPAVNIKEDVSPSYQLRRYAWSAKLPLSIVTDFEELSVFNCQIKPNPTDKPSIGRIGYYTFDEYLDKFDEIYSIFSKEAILKGSFDRYAQSTKGKKGTAEVDREFLKEIESWRELLAKNIALRNPDVSIHELNYAVQKIIDRIIFLRICEDRGIEHYGQLQTNAEGKGVYTHLLNHFRLAESKYNSGIFNFDTDKITGTLTIDDKVLKTILQDLYYPKSPYEFSVLGVEILGNVYEQFLGKVIRLTAGHQAKVETKPEVKKAGGVYYTPQYIVEYIVKNTVGKLIAGKTPEEIAAIKILDPACGSGSFLIGAYSYLLRYHLDWYVSNKPKKHKEAVFQVKENEWYLTTAEKKRILLDNIFGIDIDPQAVEVTKMSLLLKVLEHESRESIDQQTKLGLEGVLPNLGGNIKCGNSLIGPEYYGQQQGTLFDEAEMRRVNVFDWDDERKGFGKILKKGGFDCVIGNPPYVLIGKDIHSAPELSYLNHYKVAQYKTDLFHLFLQRGVDLLGYRGLLGFIVPNPWLTLKFTEKLRQYILKEGKIDEVVVFSHLVFRKADVYTALIFLKKEKAESNHLISVKNVPSATDSDDILGTKAIYVLQSEWQQNDAAQFETRLIGKLGKFVTGIRDRWSPLSEVARASLGCQAYNRLKHTPEQIKKRIFHASYKIGEEYLPELAGRDVGRFIIDRQRGEWIKYGPWLHDYRTMDWFQGPRILVREIPGQPPYRIHACYVEKTYCNYKTILNINPSEKTTFSMKYLCGLINSRFLSFLYPYMSNKMLTQSFPRISVGDLKKLPIRTINFDDPTEKAQHDKLATLVENMLELQKKSHDAKMERDKELYERQIKIVDAQIDRLVYDLYELTEDEVKVVEEHA
ncbi:Type I restriction-modification system, DNA methylase subunit [Candidatus Methanophagaceae archaeon]|nr:Type I restriction-modification system, DNA methylase subunit [Methanophagales archaeon]